MPSPGKLGDGHGGPGAATGITGNAITVVLEADLNADPTDEMLSSWSLLSVTDALEFSQP